MSVPILSGLVFSPMKLVHVKRSATVYPSTPFSRQTTP